MADAAPTDPLILRDVEQGSESWIACRLGIPTGSNFERIVTPTGKESSDNRREDYFAELCAEWARGEPYQDFKGTEWTERGQSLEGKARAYYELWSGEKVETVGFVYRDASRMVGCSPDGLVGERGCLELKVPMASTHIGYLSRTTVPNKYIPQCQGHIWVTGRDWCDWMSFHPGLPEQVFRVAPDDRYQDALDTFVPLFIEELLERRENLKARGVVPWTEAA